GIDIGACRNNVVQGNRIGTSADGSTALTNGTAGIAVGNSAVSNTIGGTTAGTANIISGNTQYGVDITDSGTTGNLVEGNDIGTDAAGNAAIPNGRGGVFIHNSASGNTVGGTAAGTSNTIALNSGPGVDVDSGT